MLAVIIVPAEDYCQQQAYGDYGADGRASNTSNDEADEGDNTVDGGIGQLGTHMVHQITFRTHGG